MEHRAMHGYRNGNYNVLLYGDGTKIRFNNEDSLIPEFPECVDLKITDKCDLNCPMCHESSTIEGKHSSFEDCVQFIRSMKPYTELAIGGGNPMAHPDINKIIKECYTSNVVANMTLNIKHFNTAHGQFKIASYILDGYLGGVGISIPSWYSPKSLRSDLSKDGVIGMRNHMVLHFIVGLNTYSQLKAISNMGFKVLLLGFKYKGRGKMLVDNKSSSASLIKSRTDDLRKNLSKLIDGFEIVSFDNLALKQLDVMGFCKENSINYERLYMGNDGEYTMYVDLVTRTYAVSSVSEERFNINNMDATEMFKHIREVSHISRTKA